MRIRTARSAWSTPRGARGSPPPAQTAATGCCGGWSDPWFSANPSVRWRMPSSLRSPPSGPSIASPATSAAATSASATSANPSCGPAVTASATRARKTPGACSWQRRGARRSRAAQHRAPRPRNRVALEQVVRPVKGADEDQTAQAREHAQARISEQLGGVDQALGRHREGRKVAHMIAAHHDGSHQGHDNGRELGDTEVAEDDLHALKGQPLPPGRLHDPLERGLGDLKKLPSLPGPLLSRQRVVADDEPIRTRYLRPLPSTTASGTSPNPARCGFCRPFVASATLSATKR